MSDTKRLDIQFGSFACSVQGFDDPVQPVQQVLQALQSLLEETPELADAEIMFDADAIERLIGEVARRADIDEENVEIVPGLVIVHRSDADAARAASQSFGGADEIRARAGNGKAEAWSSPIDAGAKSATEISGENGQPEVADGAESDFINIFSPGPSADTDPETGTKSRTGREVEDGEVSAADPLAAFAIDTGEPGDGGSYRNESFSARLARASAEENALPNSDLHAPAEEAPARNVFADSDTADDEPLMADEAATIDFFSAVDEADRDAGNDADAARNMFASAGLDVTEPVTLLSATDYSTPDGATDYGPGGQDDVAGDESSERVAALFGESDDQPEVEEADEGYTAAGLAKTAEARTVSELMVASAAWMVLIQGQTTFSRKEVVEVFSTIPGDHGKTLEAKIKGFGKAVRNSQLVMIEDGVFGISRTELERFQMLL